jgi:peptide/nickel transport system permease protein
MFLPSLTLALIMHGQYFMIMRSQLIEELTESYTRTARAKGLSPSRILRSHTVPNAMLPMTTLIAINIAVLVAGFITIETVFSWPGIGKLVYRAILMRDYPVLQGILLFLSTSIVIANLLADLIYSQIDPRVKYE